jgi:hypothetical protein
MVDETFVWFAGVDWGSEKHQACILDQQGTVAGERSFSHSGAGLAELGDWLLSIAGWRRVSPLEWRPGHVRGYRQRFNLDGWPRAKTAPANLQVEPQADVWGVLWAFTRRDLVRLDASTGIRWWHYRPVWLDAEDAEGNALRAVTYVAHMDCRRVISDSWSVFGQPDPGLQSPANQSLSQRPYRKTALGGFCSFENTSAGDKVRRSQSFAERAMNGEFRP